MTQTPSGDNFQKTVVDEPVESSVKRTRFNLKKWLGILLDIFLLFSIFYFLLIFYWMRVFNGSPYIVNTDGHGLFICLINAIIIFWGLWRLTKKYTPVCVALREKYELFRPRNLRIVFYTFLVVIWILKTFVGR